MIFNPNLVVSNAKLGLGVLVAKFGMTFDTEVVL